eukprot:CAMPEP_0183305806 /NCGR_PEP_ID=MMETSP0160_2-20130417/10435_1 /TAXON_ID=2839 ORGANISM="Odontella Sinensis, Strain Grunow 1884" /NCGR_SAMPLE_ID=MMETSP0160_2 /ASSEMBLY_ACC=CAM_ASM_000250 /LENGTH=59 /DNA_ID=CAMNT_0025469077 /DNA_START=407 /DNA_END=582 /DNA_ORIENTATION=-
MSPLGVKTSVASAKVAESAVASPPRRTLGNSVGMEFGADLLPIVVRSSFAPPSPPPPPS